MIIVAFILSIIVTVFVFKVLYQNTVGFRTTYMGRAIVIWLISFALIAKLLGAV